MFNRAKRFVAFLLAIASVVLCLPACNNTTPPDTTNTTVPLTPPTDIMITEEYKIVYEQGADKSSSRVRNAIRDLTGKTPDAKTPDKVSERSNYEVLIGNTGYNESNEFINSLNNKEYGVKILKGDNSVKIVIAAVPSDNVGHAADMFVSEYLSEDKNMPYLLKEDTTVKTVTDKEQSNLTYAGLQFEEEIITVTPTTGAAYTRMAKLKDGRIICIYGAKGSGDATAQIYATYSSDKGLTWSDKVAVTANIDGPDLVCANGVPFQLDDGTILVAYRANEPVDRDLVGKTGSYHSSIRIMASTDNGKTYHRHSIVWDLQEEGIQKWKSSFGLWEPHFGMLNGELACFFAIGKSVYDYNHIINSIDIFVWRNNTWVRANYTSDEIPGAIKNGMPVWQPISEGGYILAIESTQNQKLSTKNVLTTKLLTSKDGIHWVNQCDVYIPDVYKRRSGAPYIVQLPDGRFVVSYMTDEDAKTPSETGNDKMIFKISVSVPGKNAYQLQGESDFEGPFNVLEVPVGYEATYGGLMVDEEYLYVYSYTNYPSKQIVLRRARLDGKTSDSDNSQGDDQNNQSTYKAGWNFRTFKSSKSTSLPYQIYIPNNMDTSKKYPVVLFMHGLGSVGTNGEHITQTVAQFVKNIPNSKYKDEVIIIAPQHPKGQKWVNVDYTKGTYNFASTPMSTYLAAAKELFDREFANLPIDTDRVYGYGNSMGAFATIYLAMTYPDLYAAIVPVAGGCDPSKAALIKDIPIWLFHGDADKTVPITASQGLYDNLISLGSKNAKLTVYKNVGHSATACFAAAANTDGLLDWLFAQKKS